MKGRGSHPGDTRHLPAVVLHDHRSTKAGVLPPATHRSRSPWTWRGSALNEGRGSKPGDGMGSPTFSLPALRPPSGLGASRCREPSWRMSGPPRRLPAGASRAGPEAHSGSAQAESGVWRGQSTPLQARASCASTLMRPFPLARTCSYMAPPTLHHIPRGLDTYGHRSHLDEDHPNMRKSH